MRISAKLGICTFMATSLSFAVTLYHGQLMDASCYNQNSSQTVEKSWVRCAPTNTTTAFAIHTNGHVRMLDVGGNAKAQAAFQDGVLRRDSNGDMPVIIDGSRHGNTIHVEGIRAHGSNTSVH